MPSPESYSWVNKPHCTVWFYVSPCLFPFHEVLKLPSTRASNFCKHKAATGFLSLSELEAQENTLHIFRLLTDTRSCLCPSSKVHKYAELRKTFFSAQLAQFFTQMLSLLPSLRAHKAALIWKSPIGHWFNNMLKIPQAQPVCWVLPFLWVFLLLRSQGWGVGGGK